MRTGPLVAAVTAVTAVTLAGCAPSAHPLPGPHAPPAHAGECVDLPHRDGDPGIVLGTDWSGQRHAWGATVVVRACVAPAAGGRVSLVVDGTGIRVRPRSVAVDRSGNGVVAFRVHVVEGASGGLRVRQSGGGVEADVGGPVVVADGDSWHLGRRGR